VGGERREIMYSRHPLLWVWISDLQNVYPLNISAKRLKPMYHFSGICLAISSISYPIDTAKHSVMGSFDSNAKHTLSAWKSYFLVNPGRSFLLHLQKEGEDPIL